jgi:BirA family biotin operon repressor/biotin-[acetyl-CoA-carboxylase] ligase
LRFFHLVMINIDRIRQRLLSSTIVGRDLRILESVPSTNGALAALAREGADEQTAGQGRPGRTWFSPPGVNLYASVLFRPTIPAREVPAFSFITSLALSDAVAAEGLAPAIKWPNDVLVGRRKVAGTLVEFASSGRKVDHVILGVGVNLNVTAAALAGALGGAAHAAGSLGEAAGRAIDRSLFTANFLGFLDRWARTHAEQGPGPVLKAWKDRDILTGRRVQVRGAAGVLEGRVLGVDRQGYLVLREPRGARRRVLEGDVRVAD